MLTVSKLIVGLSLSAATLGMPARANAGIISWCAQRLTVRGPAIEISSEPWPSTSSEVARAFMRARYLSAPNSTGISDFKDGQEVHESDWIIERIKTLRAARPEIFGSIPTEDLFALFLYKRGVRYRFINAVLRREEGFPKTFDAGERHEVECAISALNQLPRERVKAYRFTSLSKEELRSYEPGAKLVWQSFTSSTKSLRNYGKSSVITGNVAFEIESENGRDMAFAEEQSSAGATEEEILFPPGMRVEVVGRRKIRLYHHGADREFQITLVSVRERQ